MLWKQLLKQKKVSTSADVAAFVILLDICAMFTVPCLLSFNKGLHLPTSLKLPQRKWRNMDSVFASRWSVHFQLFSKRNICFLIAGLSTSSSRSLGLCCVQHRCGLDLTKCNDFGHDSIGCGLFHNFSVNNTQQWQFPTAKPLQLVVVPSIWYTLDTPVLTLQGSEAANSTHCIKGWNRVTGATQTLWTNKKGCSLFSGSVCDFEILRKIWWPSALVWENTRLFLG